MQIVNAQSGKCLELGRQGEAQARAAAFDLTEFQQLYPNGTPQLLVRRPSEQTPYLAPLTVNESTALWVLSAADTAISGFGACELQWTLGEVVAKSETFETFLSPALTEPSENPPEAAADWVGSVLAAAQTVHDAAVHAPVIGNNGNWFYWNAAEAAYTIDSGFSSRGEPGLPGNPGADGDGIASIEKTATSGATDTYTVTTNYGSTYDFAVKNADPRVTLPIVQAVRRAGTTTDFDASLDDLQLETGTLVCIVFSHNVGTAAAKVFLNGTRCYLRLADMTGSNKVVSAPEDWFKAGAPYLFQYYDRRTASKPNDIYLMCVIARAAAADLQGIVAVKNGGTGAATAAEARASLGIDTAIQNAINALRQELGM